MINIITTVIIIMCVFWMIFGAVSTYLETCPKKNKEPKLQPTAPEFKCSHTWKDFPWYSKSVYNTSSKILKLTIYKPYVCIHCKEIHIETLLHICRHAADLDAADDIEKVVLSKYEGYLVPEPFVMEQIADMRLIDHEALKIAEQLGIIKGEEK